MSMDKPLLGLGFAFINAFFLSGMALFAKLLGAYFNPIEVTFFRNLASLGLLLIGLFFFKKYWKKVKTKRFKAQLFRATIGTIGIILGVWSYRLLPLAEATILFFTCPLFIVLLSRIFLKERVGPYRIGAVIIGFLGVAIMTLDINTIVGNSNTLKITIPVLGLIVGLTYAFMAAAVDVCLRWMGSTEHAITTTFYFLVLGLVFTGIYWPLSQDHITDILSFEPFWIMLGLGFCGLMSLISKTQSYRLAPATVIGPVIFTMIVWALVFDFVIWERVPAWNAILGATIIIASNLFILWRENQKTKTAKTCPKEIL
jgi:drug/metabolite transporter (DMT)-like permease